MSICNPAGTEDSLALDDDRRADRGEQADYADLPCRRWARAPGRKRQRQHGNSADEPVERRRLHTADRCRPRRWQFLKILVDQPGFSLAYVWFKPNFLLPRHSHKQDCLYHIVAGTLKLGREWLAAGDGFFLPGATPYTYTVGQKGVELLEIRHCGEIDYRSFSHSSKWWDKAEKVVRENRASWQNMAPPRPARSA